MDSESGDPSSCRKDLADHKDRGSLRVRGIQQVHGSLLVRDHSHLHRAGYAQGVVQGQESALHGVQVFFLLQQSFDANFA